MGGIKYLQFPLMMLQGVHKDFENGMQDIIGFAIVDFALKQDVGEWDVARQLAYNAMRGGGLKVADNLKFIMPELEDDADGICNPDYKPPDETIASVIGHIKSDSDIYKEAVINCQLNKIDGFFDITGPGPQSRLDRYMAIKRQIDQHEQKHGTEPRPTISKDLFFDMLKEGDTRRFCMYTAIRSQEGKKTYTATNRPTIAGRMTGAKTEKVLKSDDFLRDLFLILNNRYRFDKTFNQLFERNLIKSAIRKKDWSRFFVSTKLTPDELGRTIGEKHKKRNNKKKMNDAINAYKQVNRTG